MLLRELRRCERDRQKTIRGKLRQIGFYITDVTASADGFTESEFNALVRRGTITVTDHPDAP